MKQNTLTQLVTEPDYCTVPKRKIVDKKQQVVTIEEKSDLLLTPNISLTGCYVNSFIVKFQKDHLFQITFNIPHTI